MSFRGAAGAFRSPLVRALALCALLAAGGTAAFLPRGPVVVVSDAAFETLYGPRRAALARLALAAYAFRPVRLALVAEGASPRSAAEAVLTAAAAPACALFPARYRSGAEALRERSPGVPLVVVGEAPSAAEGGIPAFAADRAADLYRAGRAAGLFAPERRPALRVGDGDGRLLAEAFSAGLADSGFAEAPAILAGPEEGAERFFVVDAGAGPGRTSDAAAYSWSDPAFLPPDLLLVFDDSIYGLARGAYRAGRAGRSAEGPSAVVALPGKGLSPGRILGIQAAARSFRH